jgi:hypothetical protein
MLWLLAAIVLLFVLAALSRRARQQAAVRGLRTHFTAIARMRLSAAFPGLDGVLADADLERLFDAILADMYRRAGVGRFGDLMRWSVEQGEAVTAAMAAEVARDAVDRLPPPALAVIDRCDGRIMAGVIIDEVLTESGSRIAPQLKKYV